MDRELYMAALRVLSEVASGDTQDNSVIARLRRHALPDEVNAPIEELCCRIILVYLNDTAGQLHKSA